jgi:prepilin-type N-terminal cleavage/methylation domain-containing protein/prepilin-type processing-associated H-X9-DG protein
MTTEAAHKAESPGAFTLIELLAVVAVISLLLSILVPSLRNARAAASRVGCAHNLKQIALAMDMYLTDNDDVYPCAQDPVAGTPYWLWMGRGWRSFVAPYLGAIDAGNPSALLCPQDRADPNKYESTSYAYSMAFYHIPEQINAMSEPNDTYSDPKPSVPQRTGVVAFASAKILVGEWFSNHRPVDEERGWWNWQGARNFLFADGRVAYLEATEVRPANDGLPDGNLTVDGIRGRDVDP